VKPNRRLSVTKLARKYYKKPVALALLYSQSVLMTSVVISHAS